MRFSSSLGSALGAGAALVSLAACAGGSQSVTGSNGGMLPQSIRTQTRVAAARPLSFVDAYTAIGERFEPNFAPLKFVDPASVKAQVDGAQYGGGSTPDGAVYGYVSNDKKNKKPFCTIPSLIGVNSIETDSAGNLWVPQVLFQGSTQINETIEYAPNCGKPGTVLADPNGQPVDIAWSPKGTVYVSDILGPGSSSYGQVSVYPAGATSPTSVLSNKDVVYSLGVAVDSKGNVYESFIGFSSGVAGGVIEFKGGKGSGTLLKGPNLSEPGTIIIDKNDNMIVTDQVNLKLNTYKPPYSKGPISSTPIQAKSIQCAIDAAEDNIACGDVANTAIDVYTYPAGAYQFSINAGLNSDPLIGVAQDPK
jgi:hypothetical protein